MRRICISLTVVVALACLPAMAQDAAKETKDAADARAKKLENVTPGDLAKSVNSFALKMHGQLAGEKGNIFFSPYSISSALTMTYLGAEGDTAAEMFKSLDLPMGHLKQTEVLPWTKDEVAAGYGVLGGKLMAPPADKKQAMKMNIANALWGQNGFDFKKEFIQTVKDDFGSNMEALDFASDPEAARKTINDWVAKQTEDKIKDLIAKGVVTPLTRLVLTNAIYFKAGWVHQFNKKGTVQGDFHLDADKTVKADMMNLTERLGYASVEGLQVLEMPYEGNTASMVILLPAKADGIAELEKSLDMKKLQGCLDQIKPDRVIVTMPKFKMTSQFGLADQLKAMGMKLAFDSGKADFTGMTPKKELYISAVIHKAFVDVNEEGTEAAAATAVIMATRAMAIGEPEKFTADHPFLFLIRDKASGAILFMGRLADPSK